MPIEIDAPDGSVVEFPDGTPTAVIKQAMAKRYGGPKPKAPTATDAKGKPVADLSRAGPPGSGGYVKALSALPRGAFYRDYQGNVRRNDNGPRGNPVVPATPQNAPQRVGKLERDVTGAFANLNRGLLIGDELSAGLGTAGNLLLGKIKPNYQGTNPLGMTPIIKGIADDYGAQLAKTRAYEDDFADRRPIAAAVARTAGAAPTIFVPGGAAVQTTTRTGAIANAAGNAALQAGAAGLLDRGSFQERTQAGVRNVAIAAPLGAAVAGIATRTPKPRTKTPSVDELAARRTAAYRKADAAGVRYSPQGYDDMVTSVEATLKQARLNPLRHPKAASMLEEMKGLSGSAPTLTEVDQLRQVIRRDVANASDESEAFMGQLIIKQLDDFIAKADGPQVMAGTGAEGAALITGARDANTRYMKTREVTEAVDSADLRASSTYSGGNVDNATRQNIRRVLEKGNNWTPEEERLLRAVVSGTPTQNALRQVGKLSPQGNGLMAAGNLASAASFGPLGAVPGAAGLVSKFFADRATQQNVAKLLEVIANGGQPAAQATQQLVGMPGGQQFLRELMTLSRGSGAGVAAANQNAPNALASAPR